MSNGNDDMDATTDATTDAKTDAKMDALLAGWPAPERSDDAWNDLSSRIVEKATAVALGRGDDAWFADALPAEADEDGAQPGKQAASEVRMSEPAPEKLKRKSLKDIAQRVSAIPPAPTAEVSSRASSANLPPLAPKAPTESQRSSLLPRTPLVSRPVEANDDDSGILDLAAARTSEASLPDSGAAPGTSGLFDEDDKPKAAEPMPAAAVPIAKAVAPKKSSSAAPLIGGGIVGLLAIAAAFTLVMKRGAPPASEMAPAAQPRVQVVAAAPSQAAAPAEVAAQPEATAAAPGVAAGADPGTTARTGTAAADGAKAKTDDPKPASTGDKTKEPAAAPTDLGGAMATAVGANTAPAKTEGNGTPAGPAAGSVPEAPSQGAIQGALGSVMGGAKACVAGQDGPSRANVVFGSNGRVKSVSISGPAAGTGAAGCIKSALSKASVGPFSRDSYAVGVTIRP